MKQINLNVNGMMCVGCENRVKNAINTIDGVEEVNINYNTGKVSIKTSKDIKQKIIDTIEDIGYEVEES